MNLQYILLVLLASLLAYLYHLSRKSYSYWSRQNVPHASNALPIFGHILPLFALQEHLGSLLERFHSSMAKSSMYGFYVMRTPAILLRDPELIKNVLQSNFACFRNNLLAVHEREDPILAKNPFFAKDELWTKSRALLANNFSGKKMKAMLVIVSHSCDNLMEYVDKTRGGEFELKDLFSRLSAEVIASSAFGIEGRSFEDELDSYAIVNIAKDVFDPSTFRYLQQIVTYFVPKLGKLMGVAIVPKEIDQVVKSYLKRLIKARLQSDEMNDDFLQFTMEDLKLADENMMVAKATSILFDGYETTSSTLAFMIYRLAENVEVQKKARDEVIEVLDRFDGKFTYEAVNSLVYLEQVMMETVRLHPAFGDVTKICNKDITLVGQDKLSCSLRPNVLVLISIMGMHMDEEFWPNSAKFNPERFHPDEVAKRHKFTFLGFGAGSRVCPGKRMGTMIVKATAAIILKNYMLEKSSRMEGSLKLSTSTFAAVVDGGVWVNFKRIQSDH